MTPADQRVLNVVTSHFRVHGFAPSYRELAQMVGAKGTNSVFRSVARLLDDGYLIKTNAGRRNFAPANPLARFSTTELRAELTRRETPHG